MLMGAGSVPVVEGVGPGARDARTPPEPRPAEAVQAAAACAAPRHVHATSYFLLTALPVQLMHLHLRFAKDAFSRIAAW